MSEKASATHETELSKAKERIAELEAELHKRSKATSHDDTHTHRAADSARTASQTKIDAATRMIRGLSMASVEGINIFADSLSAFANGVTSRNSASGHTSTRKLASRLPADVVGGFSDAVDRMSEIGPRAAERYAKAYREGEQEK
jgi:hypothetical protein